jgi:SAM-dependent methyltransferase
MPNPWDEIFKKHGPFFTEPHEDMPRIIEMLKEEKPATVLDLGSGSGRHTVYLAGKGFSVFGLDDAPEGIEITREWLAKEGLEADLQLGSMTEPLPYDDAFFDAVISVQVIHHAKIAAIRDIAGEILRVLKKGGFVFLTVPTLRNQGETFREIEPGTFVPLDGREEGLPHHYFTLDELRDVFGEFDITDIHLDSTQHYCLTGFRR